MPNDDFFSRLDGHGNQFDVVGRLHFLIRRRGVKAVLDVVVGSRRVLLQLSARHVMIGQQQPMRTDERSGAAVVEASSRRDRIRVGHSILEPPFFISGQARYLNRLILWLLSEEIPEIKIFILPQVIRAMG